VCGASFTTARGAMTNIVGGHTNCVEPSPWFEKTVTACSGTAQASESRPYFAETEVRHINHVALGFMNFSRSLPKGCSWGGIAAGVWRSQVRKWKSHSDFSTDGSRIASTA
jgi:hypothetical protein